MALTGTGRGKYKPKKKPKVSSNRAGKKAALAKTKKLSADLYKTPSAGTSPGTGNRGGQHATGPVRNRYSENDKRWRDARRRVTKPTVKKKKVTKPKTTRPKTTRPKNKGKGKKKGGSKRTKKPKKPRVKVTPPKTNPTPPKDTVKTAPTPKPVEVTVINDESYQQGEIINAYLAMAAIELFQHTNATSVDGMVSDVNIINVISSRRRQYTANRLIDLAGSMIRLVWISNGYLYLDIEDSVAGSWELCNLQFDIIEGTPETKYQVIETREDNVYS
jgi:hypothetical protein